MEKFPVALSRRVAKASLRQANTSNGMLKGWKSYSRASRRRSKRCRTSSIDSR